MFDSTLSVVNTNVLVDEGADHAELIYVIGMMLPLQMQPGAPPLIAQAGVIRVPMNKAALLDHAEKMVEAAEKLPDERPPSSIILPTGPDDAERVAREMKQLRGDQ